MWAYNNRGSLLLEKGDCSRAMPDFEMVIRKMPDQGSAWVGSAICAQRAPDRGVGWWEANQDRWSAAPATADKYLGMALFAFSRGNLEAAEIMAKRAAEIEPENAEVKAIASGIQRADQDQVDTMFQALDKLSGN
jgi:tetratricopeptide (TPR) repeat protein